MKALSLKQPYAELVVSGKKKIELRKWNTNFRGEFLIHASKNPDEEAMKKFGFKSLPVSRIIGKATLKEVKTYSSPEDCDKDKELHLASNAWGSFGFMLENPQRIKEIPCSGNLGFWEFKPAFSNL
jgi:predicted transcriptional regulator